MSAHSLALHPVLAPHTRGMPKVLVLDALCCLPQPEGLAKSCGTRMFLWNKDTPPPPPQAAHLLSCSLPREPPFRGGTLWVWWVHCFCSYARKKHILVAGSGGSQAKAITGTF